MAASTEIRVLPVQKVAWDFTFAFLALRLWLGVRALFVGIQKYAAYKSVAMPLIDPSTGQPDASGVMVNVSVKSTRWQITRASRLGSETSSRMTRCFRNLP